MLWFFVVGCAAQDLESLLAAQDVVSPQGLIIIRREIVPLRPAADFVVSRYDDDDRRDFFECPCGRDVATLCAETLNERDDDYSVFATVYEKRLCLARQKISPPCEAHLREAPTVVEYCYSDIERYCADVPPGDNRVHACLAASDLEPVCADYVASVVQDDKDVDFFDSIIDASLNLIKTLFQDDDVFSDPSFSPPPPPPPPPPAVVKKKTLHPRYQKEGEKEEEEEEEDRPHHQKEEEEEEEDPAPTTDLDNKKEKPQHHHHHAAKYLRTVLFFFVLASALVALATLLGYTARKIKERKDKLTFKSKLAPLLIEGNDAA